MGQSIRRKKIPINIHIVLKNYKYTKSLFLNTLKCNHLPTKTKTKTKKKQKTNKKTNKQTNQKNNNNVFFFFNTRLARIFIFIFKLEYS